MALIKLEKITVEYPIYNSTNISLRNKLMSISTGGKIDFGSNNILIVKAIDNLSIELHNGDRVGLIGHNGAGKSTLLKTIAGIITPNKGKVTVKGKIATMFHLEAGMDIDSSGYENIIRIGMLQGASKQLAKDLTEEIEQTSELGNFLSMPVHTYSTGMKTRLTFAIISALKPNILLIDEILGSVDSDFQIKTQKKLNAKTNNNQILVLASHDENIIKCYCNKIIRFKKDKRYNLDTI